MKLGRRPSFKMTSPVPHHPSPETMIICDYEWSWRTALKTSSLRPHHPSPETIMICHWEWSWAAGPAYKRQVQCPIIQVQRESEFVIRKEAGPKAQLQDDKSSAPSSKPGKNHNLSIRLKLKDRLQNSKSKAPSSKSRNNHNLSLTTRPMPHHPSPETIIICY